MRGDLGISATVRSFHACTKISRHFFRIFTKYAWKYHYKKVPNETNLCQETNIASKFAFLETSAIFTRKLSKNCLSFLMGAILAIMFEWRFVLKIQYLKTPDPDFCRMSARWIVPVQTILVMNCPKTTPSCDESSPKQTILVMNCSQTHHPCDELSPKQAILVMDCSQTHHP